MKNAKSMLLTLFCTIVILTVGYIGIVVCGAQVMKTSSEPEQVIQTGNMANLFYSELVSNVELAPWNYYMPENNKDNGNTGRKVFFSDSPYLQEEIFYKMIAEITGVDLQKITDKYNQKKYTITEKMTQGEKDGKPVELYFYRGYIMVKKQKYRVKIACDKKSIISFSCTPVIKGGMTAAEGWKEKKEVFLEELKKNPQEILEDFKMVYNAFYSDAREKKKLDIEKLLEKEDAIQVMELKNSILLVIEEDITIGLYYDVLGERVTGFHFFYE